VINPVMLAERNGALMTSERRVHPITGFDLDTVDKLLTTTRAVRKRLDLSRHVPLGVIEECLTIATQAPTGSNAQLWRWVIITDPSLRGSLAELYRDLPPRDVRTEPDVPATPQQVRMLDSAHFLMEHLADVPVFVVPCTRDAGGAAGWAPSIYPAVWSLILALRSRGLGSVITTAHLHHREKAAELLGIPAGYAQACLLPVAYYTGHDFKPADREPLDHISYLNRWGEPFAAR
jgi:nitroreductase